MRRTTWFGIGVVLVMIVAGAVSILPGAASGLSSFLGTSVNGAAVTSEPAWNSGYLCSSISYGPNPGDVTCVSQISDSQVPLTYNFSAGTVRNGVVNVSIYGSRDCVDLNFASFFTTINLDLFGSGYSCGTKSNQSGNWSESHSAQWVRGDWGHRNWCYGGSGDWNGSGVYADWHNGGSGKNCGSGVNVVLNSEADTLNLNQSASNSRCGNQFSPYVTNITVYGTTTVVNAVQSQGTRGLNTTVTYIGTKPGFSVCPSGITYGRVKWTEASYGSRNVFGTIFVDGKNVAHPPADYAYFTLPLAPPAGVSYGYYNFYGNETTQTAPSGSCQYLAQ